MLILSLLGNWLTYKYRIIWLLSPNWIVKKVEQMNYFNNIHSKERSPIVFGSRATTYSSGKHNSKLKSKESCQKGSARISKTIIIRNKKNKKAGSISHRGTPWNQNGYRVNIRIRI